jgi:nucleoside-triphosphatase THEP1
VAGFKKATKAAAKLRLGLVGPAGSGKTYTALRVAKGLGGKIAVIDTERGSASLYAGERGIDFDVIELETYEVQKFVDGIKAAVDGGYSVLVIDSLSHAWAGKGGILEFVDNAGKRNQGGGNFGAWREATPQHNRLVDAILGAPLHLICTLRSKVEYVVENVGGRNQVRKVGLQPVQRDGLEYEFTVVGDVTQDHDLVVTKTRAAFLKDAVIREAGEDLGQQLAAWLSDGDPVPAKPVKVEPAKADPANVEEIAGHIRTAKTVRSLGNMVTRLDTMLSEGQITSDQWSELTDLANARHDEIEPRTEAAT